MHRIIRYEIDKLNSNYSAASDVGRYTILEREGGMYLDTDVHPPEEVEVKSKFCCKFPFIRPIELVI